MGGPVITLALRSQEDVLLTRRRARDLAGFLQLGAEAQSRLATAVWEVARLALRHGSKGEVEFAVRGRAAGRRGHHPRHRRGRAHGRDPGRGARPPRPRQAAPARRPRRGARRRRRGARAADQRARARTPGCPGLEELSHVMGSLQRHESRRGRGRAQRAAHAERRARERARHPERARARAGRAQPRARRHQPRGHRAAGRARSAGAGAARARGGQRELPARR